MSKDLYIKAHEELVDEAMDANPELSWSDAYELTADRAYDRMVDMLAAAADAAKDRAKYGN